MWRIWAKETNRSYLDKYKLTWITIGTDEKEPCQNLELNMKEKVNLSTIWIQVAIRIEQGLEGPIKSQCDNLIEPNYCFLNLFTSTHHIYTHTHMHTWLILGRLLEECLMLAAAHATMRAISWGT